MYVCGASQYLLGLKAGREQCRSSHSRVVLYNSSMLFVDTISLKESNNGLMMMLNWMNTCVKENYTGASFYTM